MKNAMEGSKTFPYIVWTLVFIFVATLFILGKNAYRHLQQLDKKTNTLEQSLQLDLEKEKIENFE